MAALEHFTQLAAASDAAATPNFDVHNDGDIGTLAERLGMSLQAINQVWLLGVLEHVAHEDGFDAGPWML